MLCLFYVIAQNTEKVGFLSCLCFDMMDTDLINIWVCFILNMPPNQVINSYDI